MNALLMQGIFLSDRLIGRKRAAIIPLNRSALKQPSGSLRSPR
jgi:hypothetical protein